MNERDIWNETPSGPQGSAPWDDAARRQAPQPPPWEEQSFWGAPSGSGAQPGPQSGPEVPETPAPKKRKPSTVGAVITGNILSRSEVRRAYPYMIFVVALMFFYIANAFRAQRIYREHAALTEQVKELRSKSMTIASQKMQATRQSRIMVELERRGIPLHESLTPNKVIPRDKK